MAKKCVTGKCALCEFEKELKLSHIVPKFVIRYLKESSTGAIRNAENPNIVVQDGEKHYLLCEECEQRFSKQETAFANDFFHPYMKENEKEFQYSLSTYYFLTSVSWRSLYMDILDFVQNYEKIGLDLDTLNCLIKSEREMRSYLLGEQEEISGIEHHLFFFEDIKECYFDTAEFRPHTTIHRGITSYTFFNSELKTSATITNMMGIVLFTLYSRHKDEIWKNTEVKNGDGIIRAKCQHIESNCSNELLEILKTVKDSQNNLRQTQKDKINNNINVENFKQSKAYADLRKDFK